MLIPRLFKSLWRLPVRAWRVLRSLGLMARVTKRSPGARIVVEDARLPVTIEVGAGASFELCGRLTFAAWLGSRQPIFIKIGDGGSLIVGGDFNLGPGCRIIVEPGAELHIGGRKHESASGITERTLIMVRRRLSIGTDLLCAWGVFITDSDWHETTGATSTMDTVIGDHVWLAPNCSILKGSKIGNGCIVATSTVTHKASYPERCLLGGVPARVLAKGRQWSRDLKPLINLEGQVVALPPVEVGVPQSQKHSA